MNAVSGLMAQEIPVSTSLLKRFIALKASLSHTERDCGIGIAFLYSTDYHDKPLIGEIAVLAALKDECTESCPVPRLCRIHYAIIG